MNQPTPKSNPPYSKDDDGNIEITPESKEGVKGSFGPICYCLGTQEPESKDWENKFRRKYGLLEEKELFKDIRSEKKKSQLEVLDLISSDQGWEESRDIYAEKLGLPKKYNLKK